MKIVRDGSLHIKDASRATRLGERLLADDATVAADPEKPWLHFEPTEQGLVCQLALNALDVGKELNDATVHVVKTPRGGLMANAKWSDGTEVLAGVAAGRFLRRHKPRVRCQKLMQYRRMV